MNSMSNPCPPGFYQNDNVYIMVKANLRDSVVEFIADHARAEGGSAIDLFSRLIIILTPTIIILSCIN